MNYYFFFSFSFLKTRELKGLNKKHPYKLQYKVKVATKRRGVYFRSTYLTVASPSWTQTIMGITHEMAIKVKSSSSSSSSIGMTKPLHTHKLHILRRFPVPFPLVYEPIIYLFLVKPS